MLILWLWIMKFHDEPVDDSHPIAQHYTSWFTITCSALHTMSHNHWCSITPHNTQPEDQFNTPWVYTEPVVVHLGVLYGVSGCDTWCVMLNQWLWIIVYHGEPLVLNHGELCWASGYESWSQTLAQHSNPWLTTTSSVLHTMINNHWLSITHYDSQPLTQHSTQWSHWVWIMVCNAEPVVVNHGVLCWASGCESLCAMLSQWLWVIVCNTEPVVVNHGV
jgi:hypothetical protein